MDIIKELNNHFEEFYRDFPSSLKNNSNEAQIKLELELAFKAGANAMMDRMISKAKEEIKK
jgi:hypothetical protein